VVRLLNGNLTGAPPCYPTAESLRQALDPQNFVRSRPIYGGPAPEEVRRRLAEFRAALQRDDADYQAARRQIDRAKEKLEAAVEAVLDLAAR